MSKFLNAKCLVQDLNDMFVEFQDIGIDVTVSPYVADDIKVKMISIGRLELLEINFPNLTKNKEYYRLIYDKIESIMDYMKAENIDMSILCKPETISTAKYKNQYERYGLALSIEELKTFMYNRGIEYIYLRFKTNELNESLPNQKTVDQLKMVARLSKKTDIGNRIPDENGSNMRYMRNPIDNLESREDYDKKNKDYIPCWNLKHLLSPFKGKGKTKIKRLSESLSTLQEFDNNKYDVVYGEDIIPDTDLAVYNSYEDDKKYLVSKKDISALDSDNFTFEGLAVTKEYCNLAKDAKRKYEEVKSSADSIRSSDEQYEDPSEWYAYDEYAKYYKEGTWSNIFWDYIL